MKYLIYTDVHWSSYSSIIRSRGDKYSTRLEYLIKSVNWAEQLGEENKCSCIVCMGDFFDTPQLNAEEITALSEIKWSSLPHYFLVGNHEMARNDLEISASHIFKQNNFRVIDKPTVENNILFLPYILNSSEYRLPDTKDYDVVFSHNDIKGIQMGRIVSTTGLDIEDIERKSSLFINGHLHNGQWISKKIINLGNLTGQNFSEDAFKYSHTAAILDTDTREFYQMENPYAFNFYKIDCTNTSPSVKFKNNAIVSCTTTPELLEEVKEYLKNNTKEFRVSLEYEKEATTEKTFEKVDSLKQFQEYVLTNIGSSDIIMEELREVCR